MSTADIRNALLEAEIHISSPTIALTKIRYIGEALASILARKAGLVKDDQETQVNFLRRLEKDGAISKATADDLHQVRMLGNDAIHQNKGTIAQAGEALTLIRSLLKEHLDLAVSGSAVAADATLGVKARIKRIAAEKGAKGQRRTQADAALSNPLPTPFSVCWAIFVKGWPWALGAMFMMWMLSSISSCVANLSHSAPAPTASSQVVETPTNTVDAAASAAIGPTPAAVSGDEQSNSATRYLVRDTYVREQPTAGSAEIAKLPRAEAVQGVVVPGIDPHYQWLKITSGPQTGYFIAGSNLSSIERSALDTSFSGSMRIYSSGSIYAEANRNSTVLQVADAGMTLSVIGAVSDGLVEISLKSGVIGYVDRSIFSATSDVAAEPQSAQPQSTANTRESFTKRWSAPYGRSENSRSSPPSAPDIACPVLRNGYTWCTEEEQRKRGTRQLPY